MGMLDKVARSTVDKCRRCGRPVGDDVEQCRPRRSGWFCWRDGLILDLTKLAPYYPSPIGPREGEAIERYAPRIAEAEKVVDERLASYTVAEMAYHALYAESVRDRLPETRTFMGAARIFLRENQGKARADEMELKRLHDAKDAFDLTSTRLAAARRELHRLQALQDRDQLVARHADSLEDGRITRGPEE